MSTLSDNLKINISGSIALVLKDGIFVRGKLGNAEFETKVADIDYDKRSLHVKGMDADGDIIPVYIFSGGLLGIRIGDPQFTDAGEFNGLRVYATLRLKIDLDLIGDAAEIIGIDSPYKKDINIANTMVYV